MNSAGALAVDAVMLVHSWGFSLDSFSVRLTYCDGFPEGRFAAGNDDFAILLAAA